MTVEQRARAWASGMALNTGTDGVRASSTMNTSSAMALPTVAAMLNVRIVSPTSRAERPPGDPLTERIDSAGARTIAAEHTSPDGSGSVAQTTSRLVGFDGLRAIAALSIVVYHVDFYHLSSHQQHALVAQLRFGVWVFFALSGFLLYRGWANAHLDGKPAPMIGEYFRNRVLRIYPAYWVALIFFVAIHDAPLNAAAGLKPVIEQFTLTQVYTTVADTFRGLPQTWSLAVEVSFYLALPFYALAMRALARRLGRKAEYAGFGALVLIWLVWTTATRGNSIDQQWLPNFTMAFGVGMLMAVVATDSEGAYRPAAGRQVAGGARGLGLARCRDPARGAIADRHLRGTRKRTRVAVVLCGRGRAARGAGGVRAGRLGRAWAPRCARDACARQSGHALPRTHQLRRLPVALLDHQHRPRPLVPHRQRHGQRARNCSRRYCP